MAYVLKLYHATALPRARWRANQDFGLAYEAHHLNLPRLVCDSPISCVNQELEADNGAELMVTGGFSKHADVKAYREYARLQNFDAGVKKERAEAGNKTVKDMEVRECWKLWQGSVALVEAAGRK